MRLRRGDRSVTASHTACRASRNGSTQRATVNEVIFIRGVRNGKMVLPFLKKPRRLRWVLVRMERTAGVFWTWSEMFGNGLLRRYRRIPAIGLRFRPAQRNG